MDNISALMDGELEDREAQREVALLKTDAELRERWDAFHLIGDALRREPLLLASPRFGERFAKSLAAEPTVLAPRRIAPRARRITTYALSAAASLSAAALVAWVALAPTAPVMGPLVAQSVDPAGPTKDARLPLVENVQLRSVPSDGRMNGYLLAHEGFSPSTALQGVAPYIRSVTATRQGDGR